MAQYDGSIRINTQISTQSASAQLMSLENRIVKTADKVASLRSKMDALKNAQIPTQEYKAIETDIAKAETELSKLIEKQAQMQNEGKASGTAWDRLNQRIQASKDYIDAAKEEMQKLVDEGKSFTLGRDTDEYANLGQQLQYAENDLSALTQRHDELIERQNNVETKYQKLGQVAKSVFSTAVNVVKKTASAFAFLGKGIKKAALFMTSFGRSTKSTSGSLNSGLKTMLKYGLGIRSLYALVNKFRTGVKEGFKNLAQVSDPVNKSISSLKSALTQLKNSLATAFAPILTAISPALTTLINMASKAATAVGMLIAALTGQKTFTKATAVQEDYAASLKKTSSEAKKANKQLSGLDKLNNLTTQDKDKDGGDGGISPGDMFETVEIPSSISDLAEKIKEVWGSIWDVFKQAWENKGQSVIDSAKAALGSLKEAAKAIGTTFLKVWTNGTGLAYVESLLELLRSALGVITSITTAFTEAWNGGAGFKLVTSFFTMFTKINGLLTSIGDSFSRVFSSGIGVEIWTNILGIITGVFNIIGNLAGSIQKAWNTAGLGDGIWSGILGIVNIILSTINGIVTSTAEWASTLDFTPLLTSIQTLLIALQPLTETIGSGLEWFWNNVLLPIGSWVIQDAVPVFLYMISAAITALNTVLTAFKPFGLWLWKNFLQPLGEWAGDTFIAAIETITGLLSSFSSSVIPALQSAWENISGVLKPFGDFLKDTFVSIWEDMLKPALTFLSETVLPAVISTFQNLWTNVLVPFGEFIKSVLKPVISVLSSALSALWKNVVVPLAQFIGSVFKTAFKGIYEILNKTVIPIVKNVIKVFQNLWNNVLKPIGTFLTNTFKPIFEGVFTSIKTIIGGMKKIFNGLITFITGVFTGNWEKAWNGITSIFNGVKTVIKGVINGILSVIEGLANGVIKGINFVIGALNKLKFDIPDWVPELGGKSFGLNIPELKQVSIPRLASGAVIPANKEFLAVLGDQKHGTNIEAPLDTIKQANKEAFLEVLSKLGISGNSRSSFGGETFVFQVDGKTFFEITRKEAQQYFNRTGRPAFPT